MENSYSRCARELPLDWNTRPGFEKWIRQLDRTSSPGWPLCRVATTIGKFLYPKETLDPDPSRVEMLWQMVQQVFRCEYDHVFKAFVKPEPHKKEKADERRWRLILASSLPIQIVWHMTMGHLERSFLEEQPLITMSYGEIFVGGSWQHFKMSCEQSGTTWATDKKAWDWNSPGWVYIVCRELRKRLTRGSTPEWERMVDWLYADAYQNSKVMLSTGHVYRQTESGLMKSGLVVTISDNSLGQDVVDHAAQLSVGQLPNVKKVTGDDVIQRKPADPEEYLARLQKFGCVVKQAEDKLEFMGFDLENQPKPIYPHKHLWNLERLNPEFLPGVLDSYCRLYANQPVFQVFFQKLARKLNVPLKSPAYYRYFMNNPNALYGKQFRNPKFLDGAVEWQGAGRGD